MMRRREFIALLGGAAAAWALAGARRSIGLLILSHTAVSLLRKGAGK